MNIGQAEKQAGLPAKTLRYYEEIDLVVPGRLANGYRDYHDRDIHRLRFVQRARRLGFTIEDCRNLLALWDDTHRASREVKRIATEHLVEIDQKIEELMDLRSVLSELVEGCRGDHRPDCPIIEGLAGGTTGNAVRES
jgi:Cu(I)-responsive transcriptional regulator